MQCHLTATYNIQNAGLYITCMPFEHKAAEIVEYYRPLSFQSEYFIAGCAEGCIYIGDIWIVSIWQSGGLRIHTEELTNWAPHLRVSLETKS